MNTYIDGFVIPVPTDKMAEYQKVASLAAEIWKEHGALEYIEAAGDDVTSKGPDLSAATDIVRTRPDETLIFSYIVYESKEHRDAVNAKVMADSRMEEICPSSNGIFDPGRMMFGGFRVIVKA